MASYASLQMLYVYARGRLITQERQSVSQEHTFTGKRAWTQNPNEGLRKGIEGEGSKFMDFVSGRSGDCLDPKPGLLL